MTPKVSVVIPAYNAQQYLGETLDCLAVQTLREIEVLQKVMNRIINEVKGVNRVMYDLTSKPPGTIEFE